jgi:hypothetical protein
LSRWLTLSSLLGETSGTKWLLSYAPENIQCSVNPRTSAQEKSASFVLSKECNITSNTGKTIKSSSVLPKFKEYNQKP